MPPVTEEHVYTDHVHPWEEIVYYVSSNQVSQLRRNKTSQDIYRTWTSDTLAKYGTIENYLMKEKLVFPEQPPAILILPNDFPYSVDPGIEHILIWSKEPLEADFVESLLEKHYGSHVWEWVYFVNPPALQSVRKLPHVHVFMRKKTEIK